MKILLSGFLFILLSLQNISAQDSIVIKNHPIDSALVQKSYIDNTHQFSYKKLIVPAVFIFYGFATLKIDGLKQLNFSTRDEINEHKPDHIRLDNYTQFASGVLVYGL